MRTGAGLLGRSLDGWDHTRHTIASRGAASNTIDPTVEPDQQDGPPGGFRVATKAGLWASESTTTRTAVSAMSSTDQTPSLTSNEETSESSSVNTSPSTTSTKPATATITSTSGGSVLNTSGGASSASILSTAVPRTNTNTNTNTNTVAGSGSPSLIPTTITTSVPTTFTTTVNDITHDTTSTITTFTLTTITTSTNFAVSGTILPDLGLGNSSNVALQGSQVQPVCIGNGLDVPAVGTLAVLVIPSAVGLLIWLLFACIRPHYRQVYDVRTWFPPQDVRPKPLSNSLWAFLFPSVPFVPHIPSEAVVANARSDKDLPHEGQLSQRVLWICFLIVSGWSLVALAGVLPLYLVNTPCLAVSAPASTFAGYYSTLQDLSLLRLLQLLENEQIVISSNSALAVRAVINGKDVSSNVRTRLIILTVFTLVLGMLPALHKLMKEYGRLAKYRTHWLAYRCGGMELAWLSAARAPGFVGWGEQRLKTFLIKSGLSSSLDRSGGIGESGNMAGIGSGFRSRTSARRGKDQQATLSEEEKAALQVDIASLFSIGDTGELPALIAERDSILQNLETAEAQYIASFRLSTPEPSIADLPLPPDDKEDMKARISRPKALASINHVRTRTKRGRRHAAPASSTAPTSYVAPSQYYKLRDVRGISGGRILSQSGDSGPNGGTSESFTDSVRSRIVGSRFQEVSHDRNHDQEDLPIGSRMTLQKGELAPAPHASYDIEHEGATPLYHNGHGYERDATISPENGTLDPKSSRVTSGTDYANTILLGSSLNHYAYASDDHHMSSPETVPSGSVRENGNQSTARARIAQENYPPERRETFPMRYRNEEAVHEEAQVPLHLRLQPQGPFVRPLSMLDHDDLGAIYSSIGEWRTRLKQINNQISDAQSDCYNDIADGSRIRGWLITGRGLRFLPGVEMIEGRSKADIVWDELQDRDRWQRSWTFWIFVVWIAVLLCAALVAVSGLALTTSPNVAHYLSFLGSLNSAGDKIGKGIAVVLVPAVAATLFFAMAIKAVTYAARYNGNISRASVQLSTFRAVFFILTFVGLMWFTTVGALIFAMDSFAVDAQRPTTVANGSIYMSAFFLALIINVAIIAPGLLLLQFSRLKRIIRNERSAATPRQRFRALYPNIYDPTYAMACCIFAVILASTFAFIFPLIGPAIVLLLFLTIIAHRFLVGYVYGRTNPTTGGLLQLWLFKRLAQVVTFQPILLGLILLTRRLFVEGGVLIGVGVACVILVEVYTAWKSRVPGRKSLDAVTLDALQKFEDRAKTPGLPESDGGSLVSAPRVRRGSMASVLDMMSFTLAVMPTPEQMRGAVPLETEALDDLTATERAARTHPDAPPRLPALPFADHAEEMAGILYAPELTAPPPVIWLPNDSAGIARSEAYDLQRYHNLRTTIDVRSYDDIPRRSTSRPRAL